jgi:hypothetical protein
VNEIWKPVVGYSGIYSVSNLGNVRREVGFGCPVQRILHPSIIGVGYPAVSLSSAKTSKPAKTKSVHRLVAAAFIGPCPDGLQVNHKNGKKPDNRPENLEYVTPRENTRHGFRNGLSRVKRGAESPGAKLTAFQVDWMRRIYRHGELTQEELAAPFGVSERTVWRHVKGLYAKSLARSEKEKKLR